MSEVLNDYTNPSQSIQRYMEKIDNLVEVDYGDFKRKVCQYLIRIEEQLADKLRAAQFEILQETRQKVIYYPDGDVDAARDYTLAQLKRLVDSL